MYVVDEIIHHEPVGPFCALNCVWVGTSDHPILIPDFGHIVGVFPLEDTVVISDSWTIDSGHYLISTKLRSVVSLKPDMPFLLYLLSPGFLAEMADFLNIPPEWNQLLDDTPLLQGDSFSDLLHLLANAVYDHQRVDELFMEVGGQLLHYLRLKHQTLQNLSSLKTSTIDDLLPRLLQARQFIEARYLDPIKTRDVANHIALSEYHFARLFKTTFDMTVYQYVLQLRLSHARHLLASPNQSVTEIALIVGYNSLSAFINAFKKAFSLSPSAYRAQFQKKN